MLYLLEAFTNFSRYYPQDVSRAANLLLVQSYYINSISRKVVKVCYDAVKVKLLWCHHFQAGAVLGKSLQPYESHIPFILQFLVCISILTILTAFWWVKWIRCSGFLIGLVLFADLHRHKHLVLDTFWSQLIQSYVCFSLFIWWE